ncbi:DUF4442 domain-containing protein [Candidatus Uabimicrobium sp. HlEnr_7]|uniref:DUF4442 domain-containing protein n=1 Tax=Candidatus Uabimicrobium helgolandensis TaxID=3095367 RepID=UPI0035567AE7
MSKNFALLRNLTTKAKNSTFYLWVLNKVMLSAIPFNKPHRFTITEVKNEEVKVTAKYRKKNLNHLRGIHACAIATIGEYCSGVLLISNLDPSEYRLIMARIEIDYHYQAKSSITAVASLSDEEKNKNIIEPLKSKDAIFTTMEVPIHDSENNLVATVNVKWQIKLWKSVRTK